MRQRKPSGSPAHPSLQWLVFGAFLGVVAVLGYQYWEQLTFNTNPPSTQPHQAKQKTTAKKATFEFYDLLPTMEVDVRKQPVSHYLLQVASFKRREEADAVKAELTLLGYTVALTEAIQRGKTWYRVEVGPYKAFAQAEQANKRLRRLKYRSFIREIEGKDNGNKKTG